MELSIDWLKSYISKNYKREIKILLISIIFSTLVPWFILSLKIEDEDCVSPPCSIWGFVQMGIAMLFMLPGMLVMIQIIMITPPGISEYFFQNLPFPLMFIVFVNIVFYYIVLKLFFEIRHDEKSKKPRTKRRKK